MNTTTSVWTAIAGLKLRLAPQVRVSRHVIRSSVWFILQDPLSGRHFRVTRQAFTVLELLDGARTLDEAYALAASRLGSDTLPPAEIASLVLQLKGAELLRGFPPANLDELTTRREALSHARRMQLLKSPLAIRIPLLNPDRFLESTRAIGKAFFSRWGLAAWLVLVGYALVQAAANWSVLTGSVLEKVLAIDNVFLMTLAFVLAKFVHELGHGLATKRWGGEVNEVGITLLVFLPVPYVEASSSTAFPSKWRRAAVGAAGMYFELLLAALAMLVWLRLEPGLYRTFALDTMVVAGISTVLVNANPLLRYDGYFILADLIESPNLAPRSYRCLSDLVQRWAFGVEGIQSMTPAQGETGWLVTYAIASYVCRTMIAALIALFLANQYFVLGAALAIWLCVMSFAVPLVKGARFLAASPRLEGHRTRAWSVTTGVLVVLGGILAIVPVPLATRAEGVVWAPPGAEIATETDGFVKAVLAPDGTSVCEGCRLLVLDNPELPTSIALMEARLAALGARYQAERLEDLVKSQVTMQEVEHVRQRLAYDRDRSSRLTLIAAREARWSIASDADLQGRFLRRGTTVGYLYRSDELVIRVIARQEDMGLIRAGIERISIRLPGNIDQELHGTVERMIPSATDKLPSLALATSAGGGASLEPQGTGGSKSLQRYFEIHIKVLGSQRSERFGQRAFVQFVHRDEPLATQWWRRLRQMFLRELSI